MENLKTLENLETLKKFKSLEGLEGLENLENLENLEYYVDDEYDDMLIPHSWPMYDYSYPIIYACITTENSPKNDELRNYPSFDTINSHSKNYELLSSSS